LSKRFVLFYAIPLLLIVVGARADFNDGVAAFVAGNYEQALKTFVPLAETSDHALAQYFIGRIYSDGRGVTKNPAEAAKWFRKAAEKGIQEAQFRLGGMYERGEGVPQDMEYAYGWYSVAAHLGNAKAISAQQAATARLGPDELRAAKTLADDLIAKYGKAAPETAREN
jgi:TPR repeat protein